MPNLDLDKFLAEQNADPLVITWAGKTITAPVELPWPALKLAQEVEGVELTDPKLEEKIRAVTDMCLGKEDSAWLWGDNPKRLKLGVGTGMQVIDAVMEYMMKTMPEAPKDGPKAERMAELERRAAEAAKASPSAIGTPAASLPSSRPTSPGSIAFGGATSPESDSGAS